MEGTLVREGKDCIALVESLYSDITRGSLGEASKKLTELENDGTVLAREANQRAKELEKAAEQYLSQAEELQRKIGMLGCEEQELEKRKLTLESTQAGHKVTLKEMQKTLSDAEYSLRQAERERCEKEEEENGRRIGGAVTGAFVLGIFTFGIGAPIGAALGAGIGELINQLVEAEENARREVERCRDKVNKTELEIESTRVELSRLQRRITTLSGEITKLKQERLSYHEKAGQAKEGVAFFRRASVFWQEFKQISEHGVDRTALVKRIISKAKENENLSFISAKASQRVGLTFLEAWELMETKCEEGLEFVFHIEY